MVCENIFTTSPRPLTLISYHIPFIIHLTGILAWLHDMMVRKEIHCFTKGSVSPVFTFSLNWLHWSDSVIESPCLWLYVFVPLGAFWSTRPSGPSWSSSCHVYLSVCLSVVFRHRVQFFFRPIIGPQVTWSVPGLSLPPPPVLAL